MSKDNCGISILLAILTGKLFFCMQNYHHSSIPVQQSQFISYGHDLGMKYRLVNPLLWHLLTAYSNHCRPLIVISSIILCVGVSLHC
jgi:hypothetical protein